MFSSTFCLASILLLFTGSTICDLYPECENAMDGTFVAQTASCQGFIYCNDNDESYKGNCDDGYYFDANAQECIQDVTGQCLPMASEEEIFDIPLEIDSPALPDNVALIAEELNEIVHQTGIAVRPKCSAENDEYFPYALRCEYYYVCMSGFLTIFRCNFDYAWDYKLQECKPIEEALCFKATTE